MVLGTPLKLSDSIPIQNSANRATESFSMTLPNKPIAISIAFVALLACSQAIFAQVLPEAAVGIKIALAKKPTTRPMTVAYVPYVSRYYIADGGLGPLPGDPEITTSQSQIHIYSEKGDYLNSAKPGFDNRSIYYNTDTRQLETVTYNISANAGFAPNTGIFVLELTEAGDLKGTSIEISGHNPAFGSPHTMPTYDPVNKRYFAKQERSNVILIAELPKREKIGEINLDLVAAGVAFDDITDYYVAYTGAPGEELAVLDVDHKTIIVFDLKGKFVGKSTLPGTMKLRSHNHINGLGYANNMFFVYHENEGEFGTYYGFTIFDKAP